MSHARNLRHQAEERWRRWPAITRRLGEREICPRCGATLSTYGEACTAELDDRCPGFEAIEEALRMTADG